MTADAKFRCNFVLELNALKSDATISAINSVGSSRITCRVRDNAFVERDIPACQRMTELIMAFDPSAFEG
jgi:hypothetical protein